MVVVEKAYAKINLGLEVVKKREDGYHDLSMIMTTVELHDELMFSDNPQSKQVKIECDKFSHIPLENNLIYKAAQLLKSEYGVDKGVRIAVKKNIFEQAGLAGGSADAAATLRGLNKLWNLNASLDDLARIGLMLGSDVPYCIYNKTAKASGRGEMLEFIEEMPFAYVLLVVPPYGNQTAEVFQHFHIHKNNTGKIDILASDIAQGNINVISKNLFNDLEINIKQPNVNKIKQDLMLAGALGTSMTGSGSTVYGVFFNEKQVKQAYAKISSIYNRLNYQVVISSVRSLRKPNVEGFSTQAPHKTKVLQTKELKANAFILLGYHRILDHYRMIAAPINEYNKITMEKLNNPICEIIYQDTVVHDELYKQVALIVAKFNIGLRITINEHHQELLGAMQPDHYLASIIANIGDFGVDTEQAFLLFPKKIKAYSLRLTFEYDSKSDEYTVLKDAIFGYVLVSSLELKNYQSPRYTPQVEVQCPQLDAILVAINEQNFYQMADNIYDGVSRFEKRSIQEYRRFPIIERAKELSMRLGASGFLLSHEGPKLIILCRYQQQAQAIMRNLSVKFNLQNAFITSLFSSVKHQPLKSEILEEAPSEENKNLSIETYLQENEKASMIKEELLVFPEESYIEGSPFENGEHIHEGRRIKPKSSNRRNDTRPIVPMAADLEGILYLHSGGSLFKQYDFVDIARYFQKYFHNKAINIDKEGELIKVLFLTSSLPHILGIHLLDEDDKSYRGNQGFQKMLNGEISYYHLKKSGRYDEATIKKIYNKTQSSVLIFNDIFNNRPLSCFDKSIVKGENSKMENLEFAVTRRLTETTFHKQNLLGIGKEPNSNTYYFNTSFLWNVPLDVGKKDSIKVVISQQLT